MEKPKRIGSDGASVELFISVVHAGSQSNVATLTRVVHIGSRCERSRSLVLNPSSYIRTPSVYKSFPLGGL